MKTDRFMRIIGCRRSAEEAYELLNDKDTLRAYADGINDFVQNVSPNFMLDNISGRLLPPEFLALGIYRSNYIPWTPIDSLAISYLYAHLL